MLKPRIRIRLAELDKKQSDIYKDLGVSPQQFSNWVKGDSSPYLETAFKLARMLDCKVDDLWEYKE
ncbi:helix-turn-helix transcriptional regulator [Virgibacillus sp. Bac332]|uniref:helix-turn-helix transcriptional regulator n=1 Tax=Virgibacillus sp. Bac332 TaxID=2419842 RepID=UPI000EF49043|nr:helix-turn-helix domain-containing protein [Virgibacillus sp. Bac332]